MVERLRQNIKTIIILAGKKYYFGGEILYIKHRCMKFKIKIIITIKNFNRK
jgi:hypothetical protein